MAALFDVFDDAEGAARALRMAAFDWSVPSRARASSKRRCGCAARVSVLRDTFDICNANRPIATQARAIEDGLELKHRCR